MSVNFPRVRLGIVEAERFITLLLREPFEYTEWQRNLYSDMSVDELYAKIKTAETLEVAGADEVSCYAECPVESAASKQF